MVKLFDNIRNAGVNADLVEQYGEAFEQIATLAQGALGIKKDVLFEEGVRQISDVLERDGGRTKEMYRAAGLDQNEVEPHDLADQVSSAFGAYRQIIDAMTAAEQAGLFNRTTPNETASIEQFLDHSFGEMKNRAMDEYIRVSGYESFLDDTQPFENLVSGELDFADKDSVNGAVTEYTNFTEAISRMREALEGKDVSLRPLDAYETNTVGAFVEAANAYVENASGEDGDIDEHLSVVSTVYGIGERIRSDGDNLFADHVNSFRSVLDEYQVAVLADMNEQISELGSRPGEDETQKLLDYQTRVRDIRTHSLDKLDEMFDKVEDAGIGINLDGYRTQIAGYRSL